MIQTIFKCLEAGLTLWDDKERDKYRDHLISLKEQWYAEYNKTDSDRSDAVLDNIEFQLRVLVTSFSASVGKPDAPAKP